MVTLVTDGYGFYTYSIRVGITMCKFANDLIAWVFPNICDSF